MASGKKPGRVREPVQVYLDRHDLDLLIGALGDDPSIPTDLSVRHHEYLYGPASESGGKSRPR